jgi:predicted RNA binding protein YcfA (HicA-like mRNA interferase family)
MTCTLRCPHPTTRRGAGRGSGLVECRRGKASVRFSKLVRKLEAAGFRLVREKGSVRYYAKPGWKNLIRVHYHGSRGPRAAPIVRS